MRRAATSGGALVLALSLLPSLARAAENGGVLGWVEDTRGMPVSGAVISLFRGGAGGAGLVTLSDSAGRFFLPSLPAGSYTVRALRLGHAPAQLRKVVVLPNQDATFTVSLTPLADAAVRSVEVAVAPPDATEEAAREAKWLLRHKRRSVLEARREAAAESGADHPEDARLLASIVPDLDGTVEVVASPSAVGMGEGDEREPASLSLVRLKGRIAESGRWSLAGVMAERENTTWRMAAEFVLEPMEGHEVRAATGYGSRYVRAQQFADGVHDRGVGALSVEDRWQIAEGVTAGVGGRFSYVGFLGDTSHFDPSATLEIQGAENTTYRAAVYARTVAPGGDILTLNSLAAAPAMTFARLDGALRAERQTRYEVAIDQQIGGASVGAYTFYEGVRDQLANVFEGPEATRSLRIFNGGHAATGGFGLTVGRCFGESVRGSMNYTFGRSWRTGEEELHELAPRTLQDGNFHDLSARVETVIQGTDTRVVAYYRLNRMNPDADERAPEPLTNRRFDVQLSQGLPFLGALTRADWNFLLAVRNLFYETSEGALIDEVAVTNPPKRVLGGISVRF